MEAGLPFWAIRGPPFEVEDPSNHVFPTSRSTRVLAAHIARPDFFAGCTDDRLSVSTVLRLWHGKRM